MKQTLSQLVHEKKHMTISDSIQITKKLLKITEEVHKANTNVLVLFPDNIEIENNISESGEYLLHVKIEDMDKQEQTLSDVDERNTAVYQSASVETVGFRAPELAVTDFSRIGKQTDYYSITAIFYYCLTGKKISRFQMFCSGIPDISDIIYRNCMNEHAFRILYRILKKGLAPTLKNRYQSVKQLENDLIKLEKCLK